MKVAFLSTFYPFRGGIAQFNAALYRALENLGHEVKAFNFSVQYPAALFPGKTQKVTSEDIADAIPSVRSLNAVNPASYWSTAKKIKQYQPDLLVVGYWMPFMAPSLGTVIKRLEKHIKIVSIVHNAIPHETSKLDTILGNYFFNHNTKVIALSKAVEQDINSAYPSIKTKVLHHPTYTHFGNLIPKSDAREKLGIGSDKIVLLFFGLVRPYKGLDVLLSTLALLDQRFQLVIAGETYGSFSAYQEIIDKNNLSNRIFHFDQYISDDEVSTYFSVADTCVLPYKSATQSGVVAIAQHFGVPVFVSDVGGLNEFIIHEKTGFLMEAPCAELFAESIKNAVETKQLEKVRAFLNQETEDQLSWEDFAQAVIDFSYSE